VWVNLFVPSTAHLTLGGARLTMETGFPEGESAVLKLDIRKPTPFTLAVRRPSWAGDDFGVRVNGEPIDQPKLASLRAGPAGGRDVPIDRTPLDPSTYVELRRTWKSGDTVEITFRRQLRLEPTADNKSVAAIMWGPCALAGDHGPRIEGRNRTADGAATVPPPPPPVPVLVAAGRPVTEWVVPAESRDGDHLARAVARVPAQPAPATDLRLTPFYRTHGRRYSIYLDVVSPSEFDDRAAAVVAERERVRRLEAATLGFVRPGDEQSEREFNYQTDRADRQVQRSGNRSARGGPGWFSFDLPVDPSAEVALVVTYFNDLGLPPASGNFTIQVDGASVARFEPNAAATGFYDARYAIPADATRGKSKVTVRFQAEGNGRIAPVFGVRTIRASDLSS
jgi:hypothetical protein